MRGNRAEFNRKLVDCWAVWMRNAKSRKTRAIKATNLRVNLVYPASIMLPFPMKLSPIVCFFLLAVQSAFASSPDVSKAMRVPVVDADPFDKGGHEFVLSGASLFSPLCFGRNRPTLDYAQIDLSLGWMLTSPCPLFGWDCLRGNWEGLLNVFGAKVFKGPDGFLAGGRALLRYNFVQPQSRWVPFFQIGAGGLGDDVYRHRDQSLIGGGFEFTLVADIGLRYFINPKWAALAAFDYEHISNANTASRNVGVNALGGTLGVGYFF